MADAPPPSQNPAHNLPEYTVSEISGALKRTVEERFSHVRVRGEISGFKRHTSGHLYLCLKDTDAVMDAVVWKGSAARLGIRPEDGLEVICTGRLTTFPGRSKYQMVIEQMELAGEGALLKLLEERKRKLAAEGLFDQGRKKPIPFLPEVIGVVTSPTGAVIRDILHRLSDRFPRHVLLWPVAVQGDGAAEQVAAAIRGFNAIPPDGPVPRPDVLIVARGGGSLEDLWAFNEEIVVRAAAESRIPLISAVGHETDTTLIDFASDLRAPTPTGAAEKAVPVRLELVATVADLGKRLVGSMSRSLEDRRRHVEALARGLPRPDRLVEDKMALLADRIERLENGWDNLLHRKQAEVERCAARLRHPRELLAQREQALKHAADRLEGVKGRLGQQETHRLSVAAAGLSHAGRALTVRVAQGEVAVAQNAERLERCGRHRLDEAGKKVEHLGRLLESFSYRNVLARGYAVVRDADGKLVQRAGEVSAGQDLAVEFQDGRVAVLAEGQALPKPPPAPAPKPAKGKDERQGSLL